MKNSYIVAVSISAIFRFVDKLTTIYSCSIKTCKKLFTRLHNCYLSSNSHNGLHVLSPQRFGTYFPIVIHSVSYLIKIQLQFYRYIQFYYQKSVLLIVETLSVTSKSSSAKYYNNTPTPIITKFSQQFLYSTIIEN